MTRGHRRVAVDQVAFVPRLTQSSVSWLESVKGVSGKRCLAAVILVVLAVLLGLGLRLSGAMETPKRATHEPSDARLHARVIEQLQGGGPYYEVVGRELRQQGYPARSVFNWRTPAHYTLIAWLTPQRATLVLRVLVILVAVGAVWGLVQQAVPRRIVAGVLILLHMLVPLMLTDAVVFAEACAGTLIGLSLALYARERWFVIAAWLGVSALFLREIAVPFAVACGLLSIVHRRRHETMTWVLGGIAYGVYYGLHAFNVAQHIQPTDAAHAESWLQFQGLSFVLRTLHVNGWLVLMPMWVTVVICVLALAGLCATSIPQAVRWPLLAYTIFFAVAGHSFNFYWGWVTIPLWSYALVHCDEGLRRLIGDIFLRPAVEGT